MFGKIIGGAVAVTVGAAGTYVWKKQLTEQQKQAVLSFAGQTCDRTKTLVLTGIGKMQDKIKSLSSVAASPEAASPQQ